LGAVITAGVARTVSILSMYPLDTIKTRIHTDQLNPFRFKGLYNGVLGSLAGHVPYGILSFGSYEIYKETFLKKYPKIKPIFLYCISKYCFVLSFRPLVLSVVT